MRLHYFQHEPFEGPCIIEEWAIQNSVVLSSTQFYKESAFPNMNEIDWLVVMGGSMSVNEEEKFPWLREEKKFIRQAIETDKKVIGVCLGAQMIANALGSKVYPNREKEIGWYPVRWKKEKAEYPGFKLLPEELMVMHWHGETFDLPEGAVHLAESDGCKNQAFVFNTNTIGFQFHMEFNENAIDEMLVNCDSELIAGRFIQTKNEIISGKCHLAAAQEGLIKILDALL